MNFLRAEGLVTRFAVPAVFAGLFLLLFSLIAVPVRRDARPLRWDESVHMRAAWKYRAAAGGNWSEVLHPPRAPGHPPYPPATHLVMAAATLASGALGWDVEDAALLANLFFLMLLALSAYLLASDWWGEPAGLAAAVLSALAPAFVEASRHHLVDVALAAWVAAAYAAWNDGRDFTLWRGSLALGLVGAAGLLTKWTFAFYVLPIAAAAGWTFLHPTERGVRGRVLTAFLLAALLAAPWYGANLVNVFVKTARAAGLGGQEGDPTGGLEAWFFYAGSMVRVMGWPLVVAAFSGFAWLAVSRPRSAWLLAAWLGTSYAVWSLVSNKGPRYMFPALTVLPLAAASLPLRLPWLLALFLAGSSLWSVRPSAAEAHPAWPLGEALARAADLREDPAGPPAVLTLLANHEFLNGNNLLWEAEKRGLDGKLLVRSRSSALGEFTEFVLLKTGDLGPAYTVKGHEKLREEALRPAGWFQKSFARAGAWPLPDGSEAVLFHRLPAAAAKERRLGAEAALPRLAPGLAAEGLQSRCAPGGGECSFSASKLRVKGLVLRDVEAGLSGLRAVADDEGLPRVLDLRELRVRSLRFTDFDAAAFLSSRVKVLRGGFARFEPGNELEAGGRVGPAPVRFRAGFTYFPAEDVVRVELRSVKVLGLPLPAPRPAEVSLRPGRGWPFRAVLSGLKTVPAAGASDGRLEVSP